MTVHLSWTNGALREAEKALLQNIAIEMLEKNPDVIIAGDFNIKEQKIRELADSIGMEVVVPLVQDVVGNRYTVSRKVLNVSIDLIRRYGIFLKLL